MLAFAVPAAVTLAAAPASAAPASAARPTCTTFTENAGALLPSAANHNIDCGLRRGDRGDGVKQLQRTLVDCYKADIAKDGFFGAGTEQALRSAQAKANTKADGIYGPKTRRAINHPFAGDSPCGRVS
ncbi:peptidoglycan-binding domain-containing protein [Actinoplanes oblitus]|uniref:Peptidoglycan-binding domain-containing protein n=1 Tax=Actinoplanes oblitus TaxID=3040509 RepID=A0ABY8WQX9_9ACTN|nr:peptidoglycan-binding domain-containing protein [Actinoplanes oblitus]WIN00270.1 peptidoglycan-binding domain-containing protein [Actinoplanes oblitus]